MMCPKCNKGKMVVRRVEYRLWSGEVVYIYVCPNCGYELEVSFKGATRQYPFYPWRVKHYYQVSRG